MEQLLKTMGRCCALLAVLLLPLPVAALEWGAGVGGDAYWFDWREYRDGEQLLVESGPLLMGKVDVRVTAADFYSSLALGWGAGEVEYDGRLNDLVGTPYQSQAWEEVMEAELQVGVQQSWGNVHWGLMQRNWHRKIEGNAAKGVASAEERYRWLIAFLGGELVVYNSAAWQAALAVDVGAPVKSFQKVYGVVYDAFEVEPGDGKFWRLAMPFRYIMSGGHTLSISPYYQYQDMDDSNLAPAYIDGVPVIINGKQASLYQPASKRREGGLSLRLSL